MIIVLSPPATSVVSPEVASQQTLAADRTSPGSPTPEEEDEFEEDEDVDESVIEEEDEIEKEILRLHAITRLTIAIIPIAGSKIERKRTKYIDLRGIDLTGTEMYYDECDKTEVYARISAKLGKTREEVSSMLFGF